MKLLLILPVCALLCAAFIADTRAALADEGWDIKSLDIVYDIQKDGTIEAKETIRVDFGGLSKHGIFRYFNTRVSCAKPIAGAQQPIHPCPSGEYRSHGSSLGAKLRALCDGTRSRYGFS